MVPTLGHGDRVLVIRYWPKVWLRRGQIVLISSQPLASPKSTLFEITPYIKRIVGLEEEIINDNAEVDYVLHHSLTLPSTQVCHIPKGHIFVRGDSRTGYADSRTWGPISLDCVLGVVIMKLPRKATLPFPSSSDTLITSNQPKFLVGQQAPEFTTQTLDGKIIDLTNFRGKAVVFLFISPSKFCRGAILESERIAPIGAKGGIAMIFVSSTNRDVTSSFFEELNITLPVLIAPRSSNPFFHDYNISVTPAYCFINRQGKIQAAGYIDMEWVEWENLMKSWIKQIY